MKYIRDIIVTVIIAIVIFTILQISIGGFKVYGQCMAPNVQHNDYLMLNKIAYYFGEPMRGDVIVFQSPREPQTNLLKRIIGLPGESIEIANGNVYINGIMLNEPYIMEQPRYTYPKEIVPENRYFVLGDNRNNSADSHTGFTVPKENIIGKAWFNYWPPPEWGLVKHITFEQALGKE
ncbi:MAG TPA: signal peptidase I [Dehalococcoidia bacterium]|nr:signal peptidase I [Dehalococcoidia bacterium]